MRSYPTELGYRGSAHQLTNGSEIPIRRLCYEFGIAWSKAPVVKSQYGAAELSLMGSPQRYSPIALQGQLGFGAKFSRR